MTKSKRKKRTGGNLYEASVINRTHFMPGQIVQLKPDITDDEVNGYAMVYDDPRKVLRPKTSYEISGVDVRKWSSAVYLYGISGKFNSVCFLDATVDT